jgi:hypothetical protein
MRHPLSRKVVSLRRQGPGAGTRTIGEAAARFAIDVSTERATIHGGHHCGNYLTLLAKVVMRLLMLVPRSWNAATVAKAIKAAATAYSDSSRPFSSVKNFLIISDSPVGAALVHFANSPT